MEAGNNNFISGLTQLLIFTITPFTGTQLKLCELIITSFTSVFTFKEIVQEFFTFNCAYLLATSGGTLTVYQLGCTVTMKMRALLSQTSKE